MTKELTYVQQGWDIDYTPGSAVDAGDLVSQGYLHAVTHLDIAASALGAVHIQNLYDCLKEATTDTYTAGDLVYWDATNAYATKTPTNRFLGICVLAATATATTVRILLFPTFPPMTYVSETFARAAFTDGLGTSGYVDCATANKLPAKCVPLGWIIVVGTGFTGDTTAVVQVGVSGTTDKFSIVTTESVLAAGTIGCFPGKAATNMFIASATTWRVTVTGAADFTSISAGSLTVYLFYRPVGVPI
jgi:predicted RecA/RadA family phage recombinase